MQNWKKFLMSQDLFLPFFENRLPILLLLTTLSLNSAHQVFFFAQGLVFLCALQFKYFWIESFTNQGFTFTKKSLYVITNMWLCMWLQNFGVHGICGQMRKNIRHHTFYLVILLTIFPKLVLIWIEWKILAKTNIEVAFKKIHVLTLKLVSAIFYQFFIFSPNGSPSKTLKNVFYFI